VHIGNQHNQRQRQVVKVYKHADVKNLLTAWVLLNELGLVKFKTKCQLCKTKATSMTPRAIADTFTKYDELG
jgi:hypothetical protein